MKSKWILIFLTVCTVVLAAFLGILIVEKEANNNDQQKFKMELLGYFDNIEKGNPETFFLVIDGVVHQTTNTSILERLQYLRIKDVKLISGVKSSELYGQDEKKIGILVKTVE